MPSAGRPFTKRVIHELRRQGVDLTPIRLDTGVSSQEAGEFPYPERFEVPAATAARVNRTRAQGNRIIAVGTTVTRALESAIDEDGDVAPASGWTDLVLGLDRPAGIVDGLITGFHPPEASHLQLLQAVAGTEIVGAAYEAALADGYLWHEFGDSCLLMADNGAARLAVAA
jgi:S-adenosylmethionine:tRNA ribosyltransferase-isomerase